MENQWSPDVIGHVTLKGQTHDLELNMSKIVGDAI